ncbi:DNA-binding protein [Clostridium botulinum A2 117]|uniref:Putative transcriptional regulator n=1 Tax=Clostridium botulinum CFSAN001627 TaxID=1232189 RepID=M1ZSW7_CLOBO|nr:helix-turn-helix transcriptional regulator [Clostridium botulinum]EKN42486.1 putative transcriptional regulator [Clostridium botulinum CFSAN001627]KEI79086.1 DNA-binding protein [Clostridium botulinum A2 117]MBN3417932.1 XRE family transcriptional regulator [Clostridium botulinum]MBN3442619.1 XRE family transcriptional regulator [Clostridium botulinum]MBY6806654.1 helix-turn-helix transcriptional regulator [Clostridium botulinum]
MNQIEIGIFIAKCRKEMNLTQEQLAEKLSITNRAVSKWETGKSIPDASLMLELCDVLKINVNELLSGKKLNEAEIEEKSEKNTLSLIATRHELANMQILTEILIIVGIIVAITLTSLLAVSIVQKVITIIIGCFIWGFGLWLKIKIRKAIDKIT